MARYLGSGARACGVAGAAIVLVYGRPEQLVGQDGARRDGDQVAVAIAAVDGLDERRQLLLVVGALVAEAAETHGGSVVTSTAPHRLPFTCQCQA